ncbi:hypothetical protein [Halosimplex sp. TS25]|uniref:hypothetical protein n=1 Tax=Halosimplex rarum TaxID=3396619 RepID=UPI0039EAC7C8
MVHLFYTMWTKGAYRFVSEQIHLPLGTAGGSSVQVLAMLGSGLYLGWLVLFANDWRKRYQGYILLFGSALVTALLAVFGIGIPNIDFSSPVNIAAFVFGLSIGIASEARAGDQSLGGDLMRLDYSHPDNSWAHWMTNEQGRNSPAEFPVAYRGLVLFMFTVVVAANALNTLFNPNPLQVLFHLGTSVGLLYFLYQLLDVNVMVLEEKTTESTSAISFEEEEETPSVQFEVLGPQQSGKTYLALGLHLTVTRDDKYDVEAVEGRMPDIIEEHTNRLVGIRSGLTGWGIGNTMIDTAEKVKIRFTKTDTKRGKSLRATVNMFDYPGEVLKDLAQRVEQRKGQKMTDGGEPRDETADGPDPLEQEEQGNLETLDDVVDETKRSEAAGGKPRDGDDLGTLDDVVDETLEDGIDETQRPGPEAGVPDDVDGRPAAEDADGDVGANTDLGGNVRKKVENALITNVGDADKLLVLLDSQRFQTGEDIVEDDPGMMLREMTEIVQGADPDEIIPVATKADYLLEDYDGLLADEPPTTEQYVEFRDYVNDRYENGNPLADTLIELADYPVFPVYYLTGKDENGEYKLKVENGKVQPVGFEELLNAVVNA